MTYTLYTTIYTTVTENITTYIISNYRLITNIVTAVEVSYYYGDEFKTVILHPTSYISDIRTVLVNVETRIEKEEQKQQQQSGQGGGRRETIPVPS